MKKTKILIVLAISALIVRHSSFAQGPLTPPGAPAPTMKTLAQIEPRTPIASAPFIISQPGSYYLTTNLTVSSGNAITIATNGVRLDLSGFTISSTAASAAGYGILINSGLMNLTIDNGFIQGGVTNAGNSLYAGSGFSYGIEYVGASPVNVRVSGISVSGCLRDGIDIFIGDSTTVDSCTVRTVGGFGIYAAIVEHSLAVNCGNSAITADQVSDCDGQCINSGDGIIVSHTAQNCSGYSYSGDGIYAATALNCYGQSATGEGISGNTALNCYGISVSGDGCYLAMAQSCYGYAYDSGDGLFANYSATGCYGFSTSGTGLYGFIANTCHGGTSSGTPLSTTHNVNSY